MHIFLSSLKKKKEKKEMTKLFWSADENVTALNQQIINKS